MTEKLFTGALRINQPTNQPNITVLSDRVPKYAVNAVYALTPSPTPSPSPCPPYTLPDPEIFPTSLPDLGPFSTLSQLSLPPHYPTPTLHYSYPTPTLPYPTLPNSTPTLPYATLPYSTPTLPFPALPCPTLPYPNLPYPTLPYLTLPYPTLPYPTLPYPTLPYSYPALLLPYSYPILPYPTLPYSYPILSYNLGRAIERHFVEQKASSKILLR